MKFRQTWLHRPLNWAKISTFPGLFMPFWHLFHKRQLLSHHVRAHWEKAFAVVDPPVSVCAQNGKQLLTCWSLLAHCNVLFLLHTSPGVSEPSLSTKLKVALRLQLLTTQEHCHPGRNNAPTDKEPWACLHKSQVVPQRSRQGCLYKLYLPQDSQGTYF